ncbi:MAG: mRNA-binding ribosome synthesis protein nop7 [Icmadophila ericetorum]|nr:mRNA-binding ribosome synthesis protein nop7 [Icmadophila ericetorum]
MPQIKKKGTSGQAKNFITRTQAVKKLQISLPDFRRLCIFKGIYPREPRNKRKASKSSTQSTTFYYTKDIQYLLHEPLIKRFREHKAVSKKIAKSLGRGEVGDAARLDKNGTAKISLDHIIKERYPAFVDALRDLDDALSLLFLFANLPSTVAVPPKTIALCQRLCLEFEHYLITSHSLRKSFLSIKGIYYQATIQGQDVLWLVPYKFVQRVTNDVDFRIMGTFVEFYTTLLGFVNFRLYTSIGLVYPPKFNASVDEKGGELGAFILEGKNLGHQVSSEIDTQNQINGRPVNSTETNQEIQKKVDALGDIVEHIETTTQEQNTQTQVADENSEAIDKFEATGDGADILPQPQISGAEASHLFESLTFFLSRETPRQPLEFILRAFGCKRVGWDTVLGDGAYTHNESDTSITHQIVDRPPIPISNSTPTPVQDADTSAQASKSIPPGSRIPGRTYIQPQWVWDCINEGHLLPSYLYAPGATLPPHLSPWMKPKAGAYDPTAPLAAQEREGEAEEAEAALELEQEAKGDADEDEDEESEEEVAKTTNGVSKAVVPPKSKTVVEEDNSSDMEGDRHGMNVALGDDDEDSTDASSSFSGLDEDHLQADDVAPHPTTIHQAELEAEALGLPFSNTLASNPDAPAPLKSILKRSANNPKQKIINEAKKKRREEEEELERRKGMMGRRKRKLHDKMVYGLKKKEDEGEMLRGKRRRLEMERARKAT